MLTGWVATTDSKAKVYESIQGSDDNEDYFQTLSSIVKATPKAKIYFADEEDAI